MNKFIADEELLELEDYFAILKKVRAYQRQIKNSIKVYQLSHIDFEVLHYLYQKFVQPGVIAKEAVLNKPQLTRSMRCLEDLHLMEYNFVENDRRARVIQITNKGQELYEQIVCSLINIGLNSANDISNR